MSGQINLAYIKNNTIIYQNIMQQNAKTVNSIELHKLLNYDTESYSLAETNILSNVAFQAAMLGGKAVYSAMQGLANGIYIFQLSTDREVLTGKVVKN